MNRGHDGRGGKGRQGASPLRPADPFRLVHPIRGSSVSALVGLSFILALVLPVRAQAGNAVVPGVPRADAAFEAIGVRWPISGDADGDSTFTLEFRRVSETVWRPAAPATRAWPDLLVGNPPAPLGLSYWAASALWLTPGQTYQLRLTLNDPDGGSATQTLTLATRNEPGALSGRERFVGPGSGGGVGTGADPFRGLQAAADAAQPGDLFVVAAGTYAPFTLTRSGAPGQPIVFRGPADGSAIIDGAGTSRGVVTLGDTSQSLQHVALESLTIRNGAWGIDAQRTQNLLIRRTTISAVDYGILNRRAEGDEANQVIVDNVITGRTPWPQTGGVIPGERGIDLRGTGNIIAYNRVQYFGDCVSIQPFTGDSFGNDVTGNDLSFCVDDGIEIDYNQSNVRVWRNRVYNARMGVSVQPIAGGPAYIWRNELFNFEGNPLKLNNNPTGVWFVHNTSAKLGNGLDAASIWRNTTFRNNLILGTEYAFEFTSSPDQGFRDFDYNGWGTTRSSGPWFKWNNVRYDRITDLRTAGPELHGREVTFGDLINASLPPTWSAAVLPATRDLRLRPASFGLDAGADLPNFNAGLALTGAPDLGAFEAGAPLPSYGPRTLTPGPPPPTAPYLVRLPALMR